VSEPLRRPKAPLVIVPPENEDGTAFSALRLERIGLWQIRIFTFFFGGVYYWFSTNRGGESCD
jgi:hypothetical protein